MPTNHSERLMGGVPCEVIIDTTRKLVLHDAYDSREDSQLDFHIPDKGNLMPIFKRAVAKLRRKHNYQTLRFTKKEIRQNLADMKTRGKI